MSGSGLHQAPSRRAGLTNPKPEIRHPFNPKFPVTSLQSSILFMKRLIRIPNRTAIVSRISDFPRALVRHYRLDLPACWVLSV